MLDFGPRCFGIATLLIFLAALPDISTAQQAPSPGAVDELLQSIGFTKPAVIQAPEFNLHDWNRDFNRVWQIGFDE